MHPMDNRPGCALATLNPTACAGQTAPALIAPVVRHRDPALTVFVALLFGAQKAQPIPPTDPEPQAGSEGFNPPRWSAEAILDREG